MVEGGHYRILAEAVTILSFLNVRIDTITPTSSYRRRFGITIVYGDPENNIFSVLVQVSLKL